MCLALSHALASQSFYFCAINNNLGRVPSSELALPTGLGREALLDLHRQTESYMLCPRVGRVLHCPGSYLVGCCPKRRLGGALTPSGSTPRVLPWSVLSDQGQPMMLLSSLGFLGGPSFWAVS